MNKIKRYLFDKLLPIYIPNQKGWHLAIWNCGTRPQTFFQAVKDVRITIRKDHLLKIVLKKGAV